MNDTAHRMACESLAGHLATLGYRAWVEMRRVGVWSYGDRGRCDVVALMPWSGKRTFDMVAFEVKVSRSDLLTDARSGKWRRYCEEYRIPRVAFALAFPGAEMALADIPQDAGAWILRPNGWKRQRAGNALAFDQTKIDSLLLLALLSDTPFHPKDKQLARRYAALREALPYEVTDVIAKLNDRQLAEGVTGRAGRQIGVEFRRRLAALPTEASALNAWTERVLGWCAQIAGVDVAVLREEAIRIGGRIVQHADSAHGEHTEIENALRYAAFLASHRRDLDRLLGGLSSAFGRWGYDRTKSLAGGVESLAAIEARDVALDAKPTRAKKKAS